MAVVRNPLFAWYFSRWGGRHEANGVREIRREMLAGLAGRVMEVGPGHGLNFPHYPETVTEVVAVEPEPYLRDRAAAAAADAPVPIRVTDGVADGLPGGDDEFDALVFSGLLCSVPEVPAALSEFSRVLRPGGELRFYEHVRSRDPLFAGFQRVADLAWPRLMGGCQTHRETLPAISSVFAVEWCRGFRFAPGALPNPTEPRILGIARKPADEPAG